MSVVARGVAAQARTRLQLGQATTARRALVTGPSLPVRRTVRAVHATSDTPAATDAATAEAATPTVVVKQTEEANAAVDDLLSEFVMAEETEEVTVVEAAADFFNTTPIGIGLKWGAAVLLGVSAIVTAVRVGLKYNHPGAKKKRNTNKNKDLVLELAKHLPGDRAGLTAGKLNVLKLSTGFSPVEIYRKYLWFMLRERKFDQEAVDDMAYLAQTLGLQPNQVASALKERAQRVEQRYGTIMLDTEGLTQEGINRKLAGRALFSKLLYLSECEAIVPQGTEAAAAASMRDVFGATEEDVDRLRIVSLVDVDLDKLDAMASTPEPEAPAQPSEA